jgi:UDP-N-acetylglucosamine acyltransferase
VSIHPTAIIHRNAELAADVVVGPNCIIEEHVRVGAGTRLYQNVFLTGWTHIGEACVLHPNVIVGHEPQDVKYKGERSYCRVGNRNILRENVTIHRGTMAESETVVGDDCFFLAGSHVGHNCRVGNRVTLINETALGGHVQVGDGVTMGGNSGIHQFVRIGTLAMLAACGRYMQDVVPYALCEPGGKIIGMNRVGLRRAGLPREDVAELREAYRALFRPGSFSTAVKGLLPRLTTPSGMRLAEFLRAESKRGLAGRFRRGAPASNEE